MYLKDKFGNEEINKTIFFDIIVKIAHVMQTSLDEMWIKPPKNKSWQHPRSGSKKLRARNT